MFNVSYSGRSKKFLKKADITLVKRLMVKIEELQEKPLISDTKKLKVLKVYLEYQLEITEYFMK